MATDQRYCLECGERQAPMSSVLAGAPAPAAATAPSPPPVPPTGPVDPAQTRNGLLTLIALVGVLLLAMGVGVLIGRAGAGKQGAAAPSVITVQAPGGAAASSAPAEASFAGDWPAGTKGFTVQLQTLPKAGTTVSAVEAAKTQATSKGAKTVGALRSEDFSSLPSGNYVIYSGVYHKRSEAQKALAGLKKSFPAASVIEVSSATSNSSSGGSGTPPTVPQSSLSHPAPPSVLEGLKSRGKSYVEKSKNLPNVVSTG